MIGVVVADYRADAATQAEQTDDRADDDEGIPVGAPDSCEVLGLSVLVCN
ncbi:hypothetical protein [Nocardia higoensis]|nr:hypothetical protein [Nocardia higoensis]